MTRASKFLLSVFVASIALFGVSWLLVRFDFMGLAFHVYSIGIDTLEKLHQLGFPDMTRPGTWPESTGLGVFVFLTLWWLFCFIITLGVGLLIRRFRFHGTQSV
jgi:hypothetical protein